MKFAVADIVKPTSSFPLGGVEEMSVGETTCCGVTEFEALDGEDVPLTFVDVTVNSYVPPFTRFGTTQEVAGALTVQLDPPGDAVTV